MNLRENVDPALSALRDSGHTVSVQNREGILLYEIDGKMLATQADMLDLAGRVRTLVEMRKVLTNEKPQLMSENEGS